MVELVDPPEALCPSRNVRTAPPTPEVESKAFPRHAESTSQLEMATPGSLSISPTATSATTTTTPSPSPTLVTTPNTVHQGSVSKKPKEPSSKGSEVVPSGQKSPHKEVSPKITKSRNEKFHKLFKNIPHEEILLNTYSCAYFGDILLQGYLYISPNWFCFYSKILAHQKLIEIPISHVLNITREKTAFFIPNAIGILTKDDKYVFGSLISRDSTHKLMVGTWKKARAGSFENDGSGHNNNNVIIKPRIELTHNTSFGDTSGTEDSNSNLGPEYDSADGDHQGELYYDASRSLLSESPHRRSSQHADAYKMPRGRSKKEGAGCYNYQGIGTSVGQLVTNVHNMPRTNLLLGVCAILAIFLVMSAVIMAYKILMLQAQIEGPTRTNAQDARDWFLREKYYLNSQYHVATVENFHDVIKANIQLLGKVHDSLKNLQTSSVKESNTCVTTDTVVPPDS